MLDRLFLRPAALLVLLTLAMPARADATDRLFELLRLSEMVEILRIEGIEDGRALGEDMIGQAGPAWMATLDRLYAAPRLEAVLRAGIAEQLSPGQIDSLAAFFSSDAGRQVIDLELSARSAMLDEAVEQAARDRAAQPGEPKRRALIDRFIEANALVENNVSGGLNASLRFYAGLDDGGALNLSEGEILDIVREQEADVRADAREWVEAFLVMAYGPLSLETLETYVLLSETEAGQAFNGALFGAYDRFFDEVSYGLGLAVARAMQSQEL